ncbi:hypothetical protein U6G28_02510 [Actinomycetaceae bacterium MB13-C1-2]|nr:hypothetical protein U6G28_02510 [Actinomycetaceae bacterium MB13-C1-2]
MSDYVIGGVDLDAPEDDDPTVSVEINKNTGEVLKALARELGMYESAIRGRDAQLEGKRRTIQNQRRELARLNREHLQDLATIEGQNIGLAALESTNERLESLISDLYVQIAVLETELGYPTPEQTGKHASNRHSLPPRTSAQAGLKSVQGKTQPCDSRATQDAQQCDHTPADQLVHPVVDGTCGKCWQVIDALKPHHEALNNPEICRQLATLIRARIDEDAAGKIHNDPATYNRGIGINIGLIRAARIVEGRQR